MGGRAWWVIQDGGGDIVALAASTDAQHPYARVAAQWQYDAYGTVTAADHFLTHPPMHAGHKGLFVDRIDAATTGTTHDGEPIPDGYGGYTTTGTDPPRLAPYARTLYHVRNRNYAPHLGRWLQPDPNATGRDVLEASVSRRWSRLGRPMALDIQSLTTDGANLHCYLTSNPWMHSDPDGLMALSIGLEALGAFSEELGLPFNPMAASDPSGLIQAVLQSMVTAYAENMAYDLEWAADWTASDDWHSRNSDDWVTIAILIGVAQHFNLSLTAEEGDEHDGAGDSSEAMASLNPIRRQGIGGEDMGRRMGYNPPGKGESVPGFAGPRYLDGETYIGNMRYGSEMKQGKQALSRRIDTQLRKDVELLKQETFHQITWTFHKAGPGGVDARLTARIDALANANGVRLRWEIVD